jgi:HlyD family secretion protein
LSRRTLWTVVAIVAVVIVAWVILAARAKASPKPRVAVLERGDIVASVTATGTVEPVVQVEVGTQVSGTIAKLHADFNDTVKQGQVVAELEPWLYEAALANAQASVAHAEATLHEAERAHKRAVDLRARDVISDVDLEAAVSTYEQRQAELRQARAGLQSAQVNLSHTVIRAPISGVVVSRQVDVGQTVAASLAAPNLFVIAQDLTHMRVETKIDEADVGRIRAGLPANFTVDAFPDDSFNGTVSQVRLEPVVDQNVVTYTTVIDVPNRDLKLRPGMTANVTIVFDRRQNALKIPNAALRFRPPDSQRAGGARAGGRDASAAGESTGGPAGGAPAAGAGSGGGSTVGPGTAPDSARHGGHRGRGGAGADSAHRSWRGGARGQGGGWSGGGAAGAPAGGAVPGGVALGGRRGGARDQRVYVLGSDGKMKPVRVRTGITDGAFTEVVSGDLKEGDRIVIGMEGAAVRSDLPPPPGFGRGGR